MSLNKQNLFCCKKLNYFVHDVLYKIEIDREVPNGLCVIVVYLQLGLSG